MIERGVLKSYLLNTYTARKLGMKTTGNASRGITGNAGVGHGNFYLEKGTQTPEQIIRGIRRGLYVTELIGSGTNTVTGDYSRGAAGLWIENGEFAYPVSEITIAGNLTADADGHRRHRHRPGIPRLHRVPDHPDSGDDDQWAVRPPGCWRWPWPGQPAGPARRLRSPAGSGGKAYADKLQLSEVGMKATESFAGQVITEIEGKITNRGDSTVDYAAVACVFHDSMNQLVLRERVAIVKAPLKPGETRPFRLPFDDIPASWNNQMPQLVIAQIRFS